MLLQVTAERIEELETLKSEIQQLNDVISLLHCQHTDELDRLGRENVAEVQRLTDELATQKDSVDNLECGRQSELVYYQRHLEAVEQIDELRDAVARQHTEIEDLQGTVQSRDAEIEWLKANVNPLDASAGGVLAAMQSDLERATAER